MINTKFVIVSYKVGNLLRQAFCYLSAGSVACLQGLLLPVYQNTQLGVVKSRQLLDTMNAVSKGAYLCIHACTCKQ